MNLSKRLSQIEKVAAMFLARAVLRGNQPPPESKLRCMQFQAEVTQRLSMRHLP